MVRLALCAALLALAGHPPAARAGGAFPLPSEDRFFLVVLSGEERSEYERLGGPEREEYRRVHWARLDPTPTTAANEREAEHQRRVVEAIGRFRDRSGRFVWDDRAKAFIRFGGPLSEHRLGDGDSVARSLWIYKETILWFEDRRGDGSFIQVLAPRSSAGGQGPDAVAIVFPGTEARGPGGDAPYDSRAAIDEAFAALSLDREEGWAMAARGARRWMHVPEWNEPAKSASGTLRFRYDVTALAGREGKTDLVVAFLVPDGELRFGGDEGSAPARVRRRAALRNEKFEIVAAGEAEVVHETPPGGGGPGWLVTCQIVSAPPSRYQVVLRLDDLVSGAHGLATEETDAPFFGGDSIRVSGIVRAEAVTTSFRERGLLERRNHKIVPRPGGRFAPGEEIHFYFEVYNIHPESDGRYYYEVTYSLDGPGDFDCPFSGTDHGSLAPRTGRTFTSVSRQPVSARHIVLDGGVLPPGAWIFTVAVEDQVDGTADRATARIAIDDEPFLLPEIRR